MQHSCHSPVRPFARVTCPHHIVLRRAAARPPVPPSSARSMHPYACPLALPGCALSRRPYVRPAQSCLPHAPVPRLAASSTRAPTVRDRAVTPSTCNHAPISDEAICLLPPGPPQLAPPRTGLCPRCEEEVEITEHALLRCPARQFARGSFPETLDLKSAWLTPLQLKCLPSSSAAPSLPTLQDSPLPRTAAPPPHPLLPLSLLAWVRRFLYLLLLINCTVRHVFLGSFFWVFSGVLFWCSFLFHLSFI